MGLPIINQDNICIKFNGSVIL